MVLMRFEKVHGAACTRRLSKCTNQRYLTININKNLRTAFTKFRLSSQS